MEHISLLTPLRNGSTSATHRQNAHPRGMTLEQISAWTWFQTAVEDVGLSSMGGSCMEPTIFLDEFRTNEWLHSDLKDPNAPPFERGKQGMPNHGTGS